MLRHVSGDMDFAEDPEIYKDANLWKAGPNTYQLVVLF